MDTFLKIQNIIEINGVSNLRMALKIIYKFLGEENHHTCQLTYEQYQNFKKLPIIRECMIVKRNQKEYDDYEEEMQKAINMAEKNTTHILKLSQIIK